MSETASLPYEDRVVAFIDILGFRALVARFSAEPVLHKQLHGALAKIKSIKSFSGDANTAQKELETSVFSDSIVISGAPSQLPVIIWTCVGLQAELLANGVLTRGGISIGRTYHNDDVLYGEGMIRAYDLESKAAIYPRVILDPVLVKQLHETQRLMLLNLDADGLWHTDPFSFGVLPGQTEVLIEDGWDPHLVFLESFAKRIEREIEDAKDAGILAKWGWMKSKLQAALTFQRKHGKPRLWRMWEISDASEKKPSKEPEPRTTE